MAKKIAPVVETESPKRSYIQSARSALTTRARLRLRDRAGPGARRADLLDTPGGHDGDAIGERQRLLLIVGHEDGSETGQIVQVAQPAAQLDPDLGVERAERFIEQQHLGLGRKRPSKRDGLDGVKAARRRPCPGADPDLDRDGRESPSRRSSWMRADPAPVSSIRSLVGRYC